MADLTYPEHFLEDIDAMTPEQRDARADELIAWTKRYAEGHANPKWVRYHLFEMARLMELKGGGT